MCSCSAEAVAKSGIDLDRHLASLLNIFTSEVVCSCSAKMIVDLDLHLEILDCQVYALPCQLSTVGLDS